MNYFVVERYIQTSVLNTVLNLFFCNLKFFSFCFALASFVAHILRIRTFHISFLNLDLIFQMINSTPKRPIGNGTSCFVFLNLLWTWYVSSVLLPTDCHRRFDCHLCFFGASIFHCEPAATFIVKMPVHVRLDLTPPQHGEPLTILLVIMVSWHFFVYAPSKHLGKWGIMWSLTNFTDWEARWTLLEQRYHWTDKQKMYPVKTY